MGSIEGFFITVCVGLFIGVIWDYFDGTKK